MVFFQHFYKSLKICFLKHLKVQKTFQKPPEASRRFHKRAESLPEAIRSSHKVTKAHRSFQRPTPSLLGASRSFGRVGAKIYFFCLQPHLLHDIPKHDGRPPRGRPSCRDCHEQVRWKPKAKNLSVDPSERTEKLIF